jgi:AraC-like DNA-binding protein
MSVVRDEFATHDPELAEDMIRQVYLDQQLSIIGNPAEFALSHASTAVPGPRGFAVNRLHHTLRMHCRAEPVHDLLVTDAPRHGVLQVCDSSGFDDVTAGPGDVLLTAPNGGFSAHFDGLDFDVTALSHHDVAEHAAARIGIAPDALRFTALAPISPALGARWIKTVDHVRDDILADPDVAAIPAVLDSAFQTLATTLLATFPNTALDAATEPLAGSPGHVDATTIGRALDYVHDHAAQPVGPADIADVAGAPARDVDHALRRRRNTTLALELWRARMQGAYHDLAQGDPGNGDTVAGIAARWGFTNPNTFAVAYTLSTGGETPSDTLRG